MDHTLRNQSGFFLWGQMSFLLSKSGMLMEAQKGPGRGKILRWNTICNWLGSLKFAYGHCLLNTFFLALLARILSVL